MSAAPVFFWLDMSQTQENLDAIEEMISADAASISVADQLELVEQATVNAALSPREMRSAAGEQIVNRSVDELIAIDKHLASKAAASLAHRGLMFSKLIPGGCG